MPCEVSIITLRLLDQNQNMLLPHPEQNRIKPLINTHMNQWFDYVTTILLVALLIT